MTREEAKAQLEKIYWDHKQSNQLGSALTTLTYGPPEKTDQLATLIKQLSSP